MHNYIALRFYHVARRKLAEHAGTTSFTETEMRRAGPGFTAPHKLAATR